jgi:hypothetical protein
MCGLCVESNLFMWIMWCLFAIIVTVLGSMLIMWILGNKKHLEICILNCNTECFLLRVALGTIYCSLYWVFYVPSAISKHSVQYNMCRVFFVLSGTVNTRCRNLPSAFLECHNLTLSTCKYYVPSVYLSPMLMCGALGTVLCRVFCAKCRHSVHASVTVMSERHHKLCTKCSFCARVFWKHSVQY